MCGEVACVSRVEHRAAAERQDAVARRGPSRTASRSSARKCGFAVRRRRSAAIGPCSATISLSVSRTGTSSSRATRLPTRRLARPARSDEARGSDGLTPQARQRRRAVRSDSRDGGEVAVEVAPGLGDRVAAELLQQRVRQHERHHRLGDDARRRHGADVRALVVRLAAASPVATSTVRARAARSRSASSRHARAAPCRWTCRPRCRRRGR